MTTSLSRMTKRWQKSIVTMAVAILATATFMSCFQYTAYFRYCSTESEGWNRFDFLEYRVPAIGQEGYYVEEIGIRYNERYPYRQLGLVIDQTVVHTASKRMGRYKSDTLRVDLYDEDGKPRGEGANLKLLVIPLKSVKLEQGDSLSVRIRHNMKKTTVKGVSAIGLKVTYSMPSGD